MNRGLQRALVLSAILTLALYVVPHADIVALPLLWLSTLAHELGHGLTALALGGDFERLVLHPNGSGVAWTSVRGDLRSALVAMGGLLGPAVAASLCFLFARTAGMARWSLGVVSFLLLLTAVIWVRGIFGFVFVLALAVVLGTIVFRLGQDAARIAVVFLGVQLSLSVFSRSDYLFTAVAQMPDGVLPSDTALIAEAMGLPYWFWGGFCGLFSFVVLGAGLWASLSSAESRAPAIEPEIA